MTDLSVPLRLVEQAIASATPSDCPALLGELARLQGLVQLRLMTGTGANGQTTHQEALLTMAEAAQRLNIPESRAYELARQGKLPAVRIGKYVRVSPNALTEYQTRLPRA